MKYKNKAGKEERTTYLKDEITFKKETVLKEGKVEYCYAVEQLSWDTETQAGPAMATGGISLPAGVSPLQSFHRVYYH